MVRDPDVLVSPRLPVATPSSAGANLTVTEIVPCAPRTVPEAGRSGAENGAAGDAMEVIVSSVVPVLVITVVSDLVPPVGTSSKSMLGGDACSPGAVPTPCMLSCTRPWSVASVREPTADPVVVGANVTGTEISAPVARVCGRASGPLAKGAAVVTDWTVTGRVAVRTAFRGAEVDPTATSPKSTVGPVSPALDGLPKPWT